MSAACLCGERLPWICTLLWMTFKSYLNCCHALECTFAPGKYHLNDLYVWTRAKGFQQFLKELFGGRKMKWRLHLCHTDFNLWGLIPPWGARRESLQSERLFFESWLMQACNMAGWCLGNGGGGAPGLDLCLFVCCKAIQFETLIIRCRGKHVLSGRGAVTVIKDTNARLSP